MAAMELIEQICPRKAKSNITCLCVCLFVCYLYLRSALYFFHEYVEGVRRMHYHKVGNLLFYLL